MCISLLRQCTGLSPLGFRVGTTAFFVGTAFLVKDLGQADRGNGFVDDDGGKGTAARISFVSRMRFG